MTTATTTTEKCDMIDWMVKTNRAARAARS